MKSLGFQFDVNNPDHRAACICGQAGFVGPTWRGLTWQKRVVLGRAVQEQFPELSYKELWQKLLFLNSTEEERAAIRERALKKVGA